MNILSDVQQLEPGEKIQLVEVDASAFDGPILRFHAYNIPHTARGELMGVCLYQKIAMVLSLFI